MHTTLVEIHHRRYSKKHFLRKKTTHQVLWFCHSTHSHRADGDGVFQASIGSGHPLDCIEPELPHSDDARLASTAINEVAVQLWQTWSTGGENMKII